MRRTLLTTLISICALCLVQILAAQDSVTNDYHLSLGSKYLSRFTAYGIDLANENPAWGLNGSISHKSGFYSDAFFTSPLNTTYDAHQFTFDAGYEKEISSWMTLSAEFSQRFPGSDSLNILSEFSNSISLSVDLSFKLFDVGFSFDQFLGNSGASYFSFDISRFQEIGPLYVLPMVQMVFLSHEIENTKLLKIKKKKNPNQSSLLSGSSTLTGLANTIITVVTILPVHEQISISFIPSLIFTHQNELSDESSQFIWNIGVRYRLDF